MSDPDSWLIDDPGDLAYPLRVFAEEPYVYSSDMGVDLWQFPSVPAVHSWRLKAEAVGEVLVCRDQKLRAIFVITPAARTRVAES